MLGARDLRAFCRPPMGVPVEFAGVSTYPDGQDVCGLFDRPTAMRLGDGATAGIASVAPALALPLDAFNPMPRGGDTVRITERGQILTYRVNQPTSEDDGGFLVYELKKSDTPPVAAGIQASADNGQSIASDVLDAIVALLGDGAYRSRFQDFDPSDLPADNVVPEMEDGEYITAGQEDLQLRIAIRHMVSGTETDAEKLADARYVHARKLLAQDPLLGGLVTALRFKGRKWESSDQEATIVICVSTYEAEFSTSPSDPSVAGF